MTRCKVARERFARSAAANNAGSASREPPVASRIVLNITFSSCAATAGEVVDGAADFVDLISP